MAKRSLTPFNYNGPLARKTMLGGSRAVVERTAQTLQDSESAPQLAARIYAPTAVAHFDQSDPRFEGKSDQVENIYLPAAEAPAPRSGLLQILNWLTTGRMG